jgi:type I restriction enzyme, R subunit
MGKHRLSEDDTRAKLIDPALKAAGWSEECILRAFAFTDGRKIGGNQRGKRLVADYLLVLHNVNLAFIEAKRVDLDATEGLGQVIRYGQRLSVRFVYATNGNQIYEMDLRSGEGGFIAKFPSPEELYERLMGTGNDLRRRLLSTAFYSQPHMTLRYYQYAAVNAAMEGLASGWERMLLVLATGTGKTFIAFQIVHKLLTARWTKADSGRKPNILFLADRNVLVDQAINTFNPYEADLIKLTGKEIKKRGGELITNRHIFFAIFQAIDGEEGMEGYYKQYPNDFFDLILIDECHRGSGNEQSGWHELLRYFSPAVQIGLTATPRSTENVHTFNYFQHLIYEYPLIDGIEDGFLSPYKVLRIRTSLDEYTPLPGDVVVQGEHRKTHYDLEEFDRNIVIPERTRMVARAILDNIAPMHKTIVFCVDQAHALLMRNMINDGRAISDPRYCVRVTSDEGDLGRADLEEFQNNDRDIPVILTSSEMLTTGVDARNVRNIVLARGINSMVEFKQIVGRGTRIYEGKDFFTIIDFSGATRLFHDPDWDGPAERWAETISHEASDATSPYHPEEPIPTFATEDAPEFTCLAHAPTRREKVVVELGPHHRLEIIDVETRYIDERGRPLSAEDFLRRLVTKLPNLFTDVEELRRIWSSPDTRQGLLIRLSEDGFDGEQLETLQAMVSGRDCDIFDVLSYIAFDKPLLRRTDRVEHVRGQSPFLATYTHATARDLLEYILECYAERGIADLQRDSLSKLIQVRQLGSIREVGETFGGAEGLLGAYLGLQEEIYRVG